MIGLIVEIAQKHRRLSLVAEKTFLASIQK
jgi:hypothetical protein